MILANPSFCQIVWNDPDYPGETVLYGDEGDLLFRFKGQVSDAQVDDALAFANKAYDSGVRAGKTLKALEIRNALEIPQ